MKTIILLEAKEVKKNRESFCFFPLQLRDNCVSATIKLFQEMCQYFSSWGLSVNDVTQDRTRQNVFSPLTSKNAALVLIDSSLKLNQQNQI